MSPIDALRIINKLNEPAGGEGEADEPFLRDAWQADQVEYSQSGRQISSIVPEDAASSTYSSRNARRKIAVDHIAGTRRAESNRPLRTYADDDGKSNRSFPKDRRSDLESIVDEIAPDVCAARRNVVPRKVPKP